MEDEVPVYFKSNGPEVTNKLITADLFEVGCGEDSDKEAQDKDKCAFRSPMLESLEAKLEWCQPWFKRDILNVMAQMGSSVQIPGPPAGWKAPAPKTAMGEPKFDDVDNPGR